MDSLSVGKSHDIEKRVFFCTVAVYILKMAFNLVRGPHLDRRAQRVFVRDGTVLIPQLSPPPRIAIEFPARQKKTGN